MCVLAYECVVFVCMCGRVGSPVCGLTEQGLGGEDSVRDTLSRDYFELIAKLIEVPAASAYV